MIEQPTTMVRPIDVLVVDDDPLVRAGLKMILATDAGLRLRGEAGDGREAISMVEQIRPDVVLMDLRMPVLDGIEATRELRRLPSPPEIIALTTFSMDGYLLAVLRAGASGFLLKDTHPREIIEAIKIVQQGNALIDPSVTRQLIVHVTGAAGGNDRVSARGRIKVLTATERSVLLHIASGASNGEIAKKLRMSESAVKAHITRMYPKRGVQNRVQAALLAQEAELRTIETPAESASARSGA
jgi:DNA-binding NarL/FixJ family response regulator